MTWIQTVSGMAVDLVDPKPEQILLGDIAWSLARIPRFNGHTIGDLPWNVAQHSLLVEQLMPEDSSPSDRLVALLHDAHEAYIGDLVSPLLKALDAMNSTICDPTPSGIRTVSPSVYINAMKSKLDKAIYTSCGLSPGVVTLKNVAHADFVALRVEADLLMAPRKREWSVLPNPPDPMPQLRPAHPPLRAMEVFLDRFNVLMAERHGVRKA